MGINAITIGIWAAASGKTGELWTPAQIASMHFSGDSVVTDVSALASAWEDLSDLGYDATQTTASYRPVINYSSLNSYYTLSFDGSNDYFGLPSTSYSTFNNVNKAWVFAVVKRNYDDTENKERALCVFGTNTGYTRVGVFISPSTAANKLSVGGRRLDSDSFYGYTSPNTILINKWNIILGYIDYTERTISLYVNGELDGQTTGAFTAAGNTSATDSYRARISSQTGTSPASWMYASLADIAIGNTELTQALIDKLFGYAAHKYGLTANLASDHPYKVSAPTV